MSSRKRSSSKKGNRSKSHTSAATVPVPAPAPAPDPEPRTPSPPPQAALEVRSPDVLSARTPQGPIYTNPEPEEPAPYAGERQNSDTEEDDGDVPVLTVDIGIEPDEEGGQTSTFRTKDEEATRNEAAENLSLVISEQLAARNRELAALATEATLGFASFPLTEPPDGMVWGKYNKRDINKAKSRKLRGSMETNGLNNSDPSTVIRIGVRKEWIEGELTRELWGKSVLDLPMWKLTPAGVQAAREGKIIPFSGNHRRDALIDHQRLQEKRVRNMEAEMRRMVPKGGAQMSLAAIASYEEKKKALVVLKDINEKAKLWGAQLYDLGD